MTAFLDELRQVVTAHGAFGEQKVEHEERVTL